MKILIVEDDKNLAETMAGRLKHEGYLAEICLDGEEGMRCALSLELSYDLIMLDRMLPIVDGLTILKAMRAKKLKTPVIMITALSGVDDRVEGLDCGADDYLVKPFEFRELLARVRALSRRPGELRQTDILEYSSLRLCTSTRELGAGDSSVSLTKRESELMSVLMRSPQVALSREQIILKVWGTYSEVEPGNVDNYIGFLRRRLCQLDCGVSIKTIYGTGYQLVEDESN